MENILTVDRQYQSLEDLLSSAEESSERSFILSDREYGLIKGRKSAVRSVANVRSKTSKDNKEDTLNKDSEGDGNVSEEENKVGKASPTSDDYDTDLEDDDDEDEKNRERRENVDIGHVSYMDACQLLGSSPIRLILQQLREREIRLQHVGLNAKDTVALAYALLHNNRVESLDLEDNGLSEEAIVHVVEVLHHNINIANLSLSENALNKSCAVVLGEMLTETTFLTHLNLSGCHLGDIKVKQIAHGLRGNVSLVWVDLSHNEIGEHGAHNLGAALEINDTLEVLNLSWNHIRRMGAVALCRGLQKNTSIVNLNLSWNGFAFEGSIVLEEAIKLNKTIRVLDISNNRINWEGVVYIARGLKFNTSLQMLKIGNNPISMEGCLKLLKSVSGSNSSVMHVGLEDIPINSKVMAVVEEIRFQRLFSVNHGGILDTKDIIGIRRERREDPFTLLIRYLGVMGIRVVDLFRIFDTDSHAHVTKESFMRGLKKIGAPLPDRDMRMVARRLDRRGEGFISYSLLANGVRNQIRQEKKEDKRLLLLELKRREERKRILRLGVGEPKLPPISDVNVFSSSAKENFSRLFSSSSSSLSRATLQSRGGRLPKIQGADTPVTTSRTTLSEGKGQSSVITPRTQLTSRANVSNTHIESISEQTSRPTTPLTQVARISGNSSPCNQTRREESFSTPTPRIRHESSLTSQSQEVSPSHPLHQKASSSFPTT
ncbi:leucine-rich repeat-containing protein 74A-like [Ylistrum balloti]|uniref:leucine-rich repeat-containing protein 74A-like n=1 Tax=Ylistrum balloti TaxID=509963 RepID=UPI002905C9AF|nr:leucine-rich repeat-containing protein 74A-like [Ylistrum balloti]